MGSCNLLLNNCHCILFNVTSKHDFSFLFFLVKIFISKLVWFFPPSFRVVTWYPCMFWLRFSRASSVPKREADSRSSAGSTPVSPSSLTGDACWHLTPLHGWWERWWSQNWECCCRPAGRLHRCGYQPRVDLDRALIFPSCRIGCTVPVASAGTVDHEEAWRRHREEDLGFSF